MTRTRQTITFTVDSRAAIAQSDKTHPGVHDIVPPGGTTLLHATGSKDLTGLRILLADDDEDVLDSLTILLRMSGFDVHATSGGHAALTELGAARYDVALIDLSMPEVSGYEIALALRGWSADRRPLLVAITGWGRETDRERALACGFDRHMVKPVALNDLKDLFASVPARGAA